MVLANSRQQAAQAQIKQSGLQPTQWGPIASQPPQQVALQHQVIPVPTGSGQYPVMPYQQAPGLMHMLSQSTGNFTRQPFEVLKVE